MHRRCLGVPFLLRVVPPFKLHRAGKYQWVFRQICLKDYFPKNRRKNHRKKVNVLSVLLRLFANSLYLKQFQYKVKLVYNEQNTVKTLWIYDLSQFVGFTSVLNHNDSKLWEHAKLRLAISNSCNHLPQKVIQEQKNLTKCHYQITSLTNVLWTYRN